MPRCDDGQREVPRHGVPERGADARRRKIELAARGQSNRVGTAGERLEGDVESLLGVVPLLLGHEERGVDGDRNVTDLDLGQFTGGGRHWGDCRLAFGGRDVFRRLNRRLAGEGGRGGILGADSGRGPDQEGEGGEEDEKGHQCGTG